MLSHKIREDLKPREAMLRDRGQRKQGSINLTNEVKTVKHATKMEDFLQPIRGGRISDHITGQIKKAILSRKLIPGDRLPTEVELAEKFKTSRVTIREAIRMLELHGFLHVRKGARGGTFVKGIDLDVVKKSLLDYLHFGDLTVENIFEVRFILEPAAAVLAAKRRTKSDLGEMKKIIDETDVFIKKMSHSKNVESQLMERSYEDDLNIQFHKAIAKASHNPILGVTLESVVDLHHAEINLLKPKLKTKSLSLKGHKLIYEHILNQDGELVREEMMSHLNGIKKIFLKMESQVKM